MEQLRAWKLRPGSDPYTVDQVLNTGLIQLDYEVPRLKTDMNRAQLIEAIRAQNPDRSEKGIQARAGQLLALFDRVNQGDLAVVPRDKGKAMMIGEITSDEPAISGTCVEIQVKWIDPAIPLSRFYQDLRFSFMAIHKFCEVSRNNAPYRLKRIAKGEDDPGYSR